MSVLSKFTVRNNNEVIDRTIDKLLANKERRDVYRKQAASITPKQINQTTSERGYGKGRYNGD